MDGMPEGFERCEQCNAYHRPVSGVCRYKLEKDAAFVLDATGGALHVGMIERVLRELNIKESYRYVSAPEQRLAYLLAGKTLTREMRGRGRLFARDGAEWVTRADYPPDVLLIESGGGVGLIKTLSVPADRTREEHVWNSPDERSGPAPLGYPRCIYCGCDSSQADRACAPRTQEEE